jgi:hypothetical protein
VEPVQLPRGTTIHAEFVYDDSARNRRMPDSPVRRVRQNEYREVGDFWLQVLPKTVADRARLDADARR